MSWRPSPPDSGPTDPAIHAHAVSGDAREIEDLLDDIAEASLGSLSAADFYRLLIDRIVPAIGASGGAIWTMPAADELRLEYHINLTAARAGDDRAPLDLHRHLVEDVLRTGEPRIARPRSAHASDPDGANPTDSSLILAPFPIGAGQSGVVELVDRREMTGAAERGYLGLLAAVVELAHDFHRGHELRQLRRLQTTWRHFELFSERVHRSLRVDETAYHIANEARTLLECDRVSVLVRSGRKCKATAMSGVDTIDRRAKVVQRLEALAARCLATGEPLWHSDEATDMPDEIERPLQAYLDESHARVVSVVPLVEPGSGSDGQPPRFLGVLVAELFQPAGGAHELRDRITAASNHCSLALGNAISHSRQPLAPLGRLLAKTRALGAARHIPKLLLAVAAVAGVVAALVWIPADFDIESHGELQPAIRRDVFASQDGVVSELRVDHGQMVKAGDPLATLSRPELALDLGRNIGEIQTAEKKLLAVQAERLDNSPVVSSARRSPHELTADEEEIKQQLKGLAEQQKILEQERHDLVIRSPITGQALTWDVKRLLDARPVQRGQSLLSVADVAGPWIVELRVPDARAGHVLEARDELKKALDVSFTLSGELAKVYSGRIRDVALASELNDANEATLLVTVDFDRDDVPALRPGATVIGRIHCGRRSVGYVWLHDLFEFVQSHWWW